jgi:hypothetical protein
MHLDKKVCTVDTHIQVSFESLFSLMEVFEQGYGSKFWYVVQSVNYFVYNSVILAVPNIYKLYILLLLNSI